MPRKPIKLLFKSELQKNGLWDTALRVHQAGRRFQKMSYSAAVVLRVGFDLQLQILPPQFMEQPFFVKPSSITKYLSGEGLPAFRPVLDGDWDLDAKPILPAFWDVIHYRLMYEMFVENKPFEDTSQYKKMEREILTEGETVDHGFRSIEQVVHHLQEYKRTFNDIKENGYKTQEQLGKPPFDDEIRVSVGRDGELLFWGDGTHRLAMVKILDLEFIPVSVWSVHRIWAERSFKQYGGGVLGAVMKGLYNLDCRQQEENTTPISANPGTDTS